MWTECGLKANAPSMLCLGPFIDCIDAGWWWHYGRHIRLIIRFILTVERYNKDARLGRMLHFDNRIIAGRCKFTVGRRRRRWCTLCFIGRGIRLWTTRIAASAIRAGHQHKESTQSQKCSYIPNNGNHIHCRLRQFVAGVHN